MVSQHKCRLQTDSKSSGRLQPFRHFQDLILIEGPLFPAVSNNRKTVDTIGLHSHALVRNFKANIWSSTFLKDRYFDLNCLLLIFLPQDVKGSKISGLLVPFVSHLSVYNVKPKTHFTGIQCILQIFAEAVQLGVINIGADHQGDEPRLIDLEVFLKLRIVA